VGRLRHHLYLAPEAILVPMSSSVSVAAASLFNVLANGVGLGAGPGRGALRQVDGRPRPGPTRPGLGDRGVAAGAGPIAVTGLAADRDRLGLALELGAAHALDGIGVARG